MASGLLLAPAGAVASSASAAANTGPAMRSADHGPLTGGTTKIVTARFNPALSRDPGIGNLLVFGGIGPTAIGPASGRLTGAFFLFPNPAGFSSTFSFSFPVTSVSAGAARTVRMRQAGGILLPHGDRIVEITGLTMDLGRREMTGTVLASRSPNRPRHLVLFRLGLSHLVVHGGRTEQISGIELHLTKAAASTLDHDLSTRIFTAGLDFGTASSALHG